MSCNVCKTKTINMDKYCNKCGNCWAECCECFYIEDEGKSGFFKALDPLEGIDQCLKELEEV